MSAHPSTNLPDDKLMRPRPLLEAIKISRFFGGLKAVSEVTLPLYENEIHAVIGPNGAGKSTLVNLISGDLALSEGTIELGNQPIHALSNAKRALVGLGRSYQKTTIFQKFSVFENVRLAAQAQSNHARAIWSKALADKDVLQRTDEALTLAGLHEKRHSIAAALSHGEQRQLEIAMVLAMQSKIILLDEPLAGMGQGEAQQIIALIRSLKQGRAVLLIEHDMDAVFAVADRLTVMVDGKVIASGAPQDVRANADVQRAYLGGEQHG